MTDDRNRKFIIFNCFMNSTAPLIRIKTSLGWPATLKGTCLLNPNSWKWMFLWGKSLIVVVRSSWRIVRSEQFGNLANFPLDVITRSSADLHTKGTKPTNVSGNFHFQNNCTTLWFSKVLIDFFAQGWVGSGQVRNYSIVKIIAGNLFRWHVLYLCTSFLYFSYIWNFANSGFWEVTTLTPFSLVLNEAGARFQTN